MARKSFGSDRLDRMFGATAAALVADAPGEDDAPTMPAQVETARLVPNPFQPRTEFDPDKLTDLARSVERHGVLQALLVRRAPDDADLYQIAIGERRWRAAHLAGLTTVPCHVRALDDDAMEEIALVENIQREDLTPVEEARALQRLMTRHALSMRALSEQLGKHHSYVQDRLKLLGDPRIAEAVDAGTLGPTVAVEIANLPDEETRAALLDRATRGEQVKLKDVQAVRQPARDVADYPPSPPVAPITHDGTGLADNPPPSPHAAVTRLATSPATGEAAERQVPSPANLHGGERMADEDATLADNPPVPARIATTWVRGADLHTVLLIQAGNGQADKDEVRAALWADLEALDG